MLNNVDKGRMEYAAAVLLEAMEVRDPNLAAHLKAVSRISRLVGSGMSLDRDQLDVLAVGALLHDVGKLGLPDSLLRKPARLDAAEDETMRHHPLLGVRMLGLVAELAPAIPAVKHHHERFDGKGYPDGLRGDEIPLMARIISVSDALDSMVRGRPYRPGRSVGEALREIASCSGTQFDPGVVNVLLELQEVVERLRNW